MFKVLQIIQIPSNAARMIRLHAVRDINGSRMAAFCMDAYRYKKNVLLLNDVSSVNYVKIAIYNHHTFLNVIFFFFFTFQLINTVLLLIFIIFYFS